MMNFKCYLLPFFALCYFPLFCQNPIDPVFLPDIEDYTIIRTNPDADTVILTLHGGPTGVLLDNTFLYLRDIPTFSVVDVMKQEMLSPVLFDTLLTIENAIAVNDTTAALIEKAVQYFKDENKTVVLIGHSWGAFILGEYMDDYGVDQIHKIIPMEGRINIQQEYVDYLYDGYLPKFDTDGFTIILGTTPNVYPHGIITLLTALFENRWIDSLANTDLSNLMYSYAEYDLNSGALTYEEINFLTQNGAQINFIPEEGHGASNNLENQKIVVDFIRDKLTTSINNPFISQNNLRLFPTLARDWIQFESNQNGCIEIYSMTGQLVLKKEISDFPFKWDIPNLEIGQYNVIFRNILGKFETSRFQIFR